MQYKIKQFKAPHILVEYATDDGQHKAMLNLRIDKKLDGTLPVGAELDAYILSYSPQLPPVDPYEGVDWSGIEALVEAPNVVADATIPACVTAFLADRNITETPDYSYNIYDATNKVELAVVFIAGMYLIKTNVAETEVIEWYEADVDGNAWVSRDVTTNAIVDRYISIVGGVEKIPAASDAPVVRTYFRKDIDPLLMPQLEGFAHKNLIRAWSSKPAGLVVEYVLR